MPKAIIITPVKDSLETTKLTIAAISNSKFDFKHYVFNDFSEPETVLYLENAKTKFNFELINLSELTNKPSPNYKLILVTAQETALQNKCPLIIVESDVIVKTNTFSELLKISEISDNPGVVGAITVDENGKYNFPYTFEKVKTNEVLNTSRSLSFCCTLLSRDLLQKFDFTWLSDKKDWYDVFISRRSKKLGFENYLAKGIEVIHLPHSSRPWKNQKYTNPALYYLKKLFYKRDRI